MIHLGSDNTYTILKDAAGVAGNIFAFGLFVSPIQTFRRIISNRSTEQFSGLPYIYALLNCLICMWYGTPLISSNNIMVMTVNAMGAVFQLVYIILFIMYAEKTKKVRMFGLLVADIVLFAVITMGSLQILDGKLRQIVVGVLSGITLISMFASPLFIINLVIQTRSIEFMPFYLSLSTFLMSTSFFLYGVLNSDLFIFVRSSYLIALPILSHLQLENACEAYRLIHSLSILQLPNGIGTLLGITQLVLYCYYKSSSADNLRDPLIESYS